MFSMQLVFYKISLGHFQTRSKSLSRALLQFKHTNAQHTGIWWLPRPTFCQAAPFVIIPHWRCYCSHSLEWSCDRLEISVHTNCQSSHLYFSHFVSHSLEWLFDISYELEHLTFEIIQLWWRYNIVHSFGVFIWSTQRIQSANKLLSHTYLALAEHSLLFDFPGGPETSIWNNFSISHTMFYTRWSDHLGISTHTNSQNSHPFVSHII